VAKAVSGSPFLACKKSIQFKLKCSFLEMCPEIELDIEVVYCQKPGRGSSELNKTLERTSA